MNCYKEAIEWFEKGYKECWKSPNWIGRFVYALYKTNNFSRINEVIRECIEAKTAEIEDVQNEEVEENWTENDKKELIEEYTEENNCYKTMVERIKSGYVPGLEFETDFIGGCYLFGCKRHNHLEYENKRFDCHIRWSNLLLIEEPEPSSSFDGELAEPSTKYYSLYKARMVPTTFIIKARK